MLTRRSATGVSALIAAVADHVVQAPDFALRDSTGQLVRLPGYRGKAVLLTFIYDHRPDL